MHVIMYAYMYVYVLFSLKSEKNRCQYKNRTLPYTVQCHTFMFVFGQFWDERQMGNLNICPTKLKYQDEGYVVYQLYGIQFIFTSNAGIEDKRKAQKNTEST